MRSGQQIDLFGKHVQEKLDSLKHYLPDDLVIVPTSSQPVQVKEQIDLFMDALYEAIVLVVIVSLIGFWEWRSAVLMAISIPITLAMTFGTIYMLGIDIQQVSVASLIIALGLLVDDPVVAGDSIKRMLAEGQPRIVAPWLGPTKIATAIMYATVTNIVAYLPFLMITGTTGEFIYSLPVVMTVALIASRLASMTFIPLLGYYLLRPDKNRSRPIEERRTKGFTGFYARTAKFAIEHRWKVAIGSLAFLVLGAFLFSQLEDLVLPRRRAVLVVRRCVAAQRRQLRCHQPGRAAGGAHHPRAGRRLRQEPSAERRLARGDPEVRHHLGGRRQPALLVLRQSASQAAQLRAGAGAADGQRDHARLRRPGAAGAVARDARRALRLSASCRPIPSTIRSKFASSARPMSAPSKARKTSPRCAASPSRSSSIVSSAAEARRRAQ